MKNHFFASEKIDATFEFNVADLLEQHVCRIFAILKICM